MSRWTASAPGKVVLIGEYAVLEGAPALVMAVDRRCRVEMVSCGRRQCRVETPQLGLPAQGFEIDEAGGLRWRNELPEIFRPTAAVIEAAIVDVAGRGGRPEPFRMTIDTGELFHVEGRRRVKLGLGSSAASAVAIDAVLHHAFLPGEWSEPAERTVERLLAPGRGETGAGSGIDLAASLAGGLLIYRLGPGGVEVEPARLPEAVHLGFAWTGEPASTAELLADWRRAARAFPEPHAELQDAMWSAAAAGVEATRAGRSRQWIRCLLDYGGLMGRMNGLMEQDVETSGHRIAAATAELLDGVFKPCGAGGGDLGVAAATDPDFVGRFERLCGHAGLTFLPLGIDRQGVHVARE
jgi:phosphomevalonate kinase